jgi:hypothetical protein
MEQCALDLCVVILDRVQFSQNLSGPGLAWAFGFFDLSCSMDNKYIVLKLNMFYMFLPGFMAGVSELSESGWLYILCIFDLRAGTGMQMLRLRNG